MDDARLMTGWRNRLPRERATALRAVLADITSRRAMREARKWTRLREAWEGVIPDELLNDLEPVGQRGGVLRIAVADSTKRYLLQTVHKGPMLEAIQEQQTGRSVRDIRFVPQLTQDTTTRKQGET